MQKSGQKQNNEPVPTVEPISETEYFLREILAEVYGEDFLKPQAPESKK